MSDATLGTWVSIENVLAPGKKAIISGPFGSNIGSRFFVPAGIPVIRGNNLSLDVSESFKDDGFVFLTEEKANQLGTWAEKDDLIFTAAGTIGQVGLITEKNTYGRYIISNKQIRVRFDKEIIHPKFAYYWFASPESISIIQQRDTGSTIPLINLSVVKSLKLPCPSIQIQEAIAEVLSSLDDKIDLLHRNNRTLEQMAEVLFRHWFVEVKEPKTQKLGELATVTSGKNLPRDKYAMDGTYNIYGSNGIVGKSNHYLLDGTFILTGRVGTLGTIFLIRDKSWISDNVLVVNPFNINPFVYNIYFSMKGFDYASLNVGSTQPLLTQTELKRQEVFTGLDTTVSSYYKLVSDYFDKIYINKLQIEKLESIRDFLLPRLMNGSLTFRSIPEVVRGTDA